MSEALKHSAQRVQDVLNRSGKAFTVRQLPDSTRSAVEAADAIGCSVAQIAKSIVFRDVERDAPVLVVASGINRISREKIAAATGIQLGKANAAFVKERLGYAIGGVPPVGHDASVVTLLDPDLKKLSVIWAAAGTPNAVFELNPLDLDLLTGGQWVDLADD